MKGLGFVFVFSSGLFLGYWGYLLAWGVVCSFTQSVIVEPSISLKLVTVLLAQPLKYWHWKCSPLCPAYLEVFNMRNLSTV